jgi:hypothetical protein
MRSHISGDKRGSLFISRHWRRPRNCLARCSRSDHVNVYNIDCGDPSGNVRAVADTIYRLITYREKVLELEFL